MVKTEFYLYGMEQRIKYERKTTDGENFTTWTIAVDSTPIHKNILSTFSTATQEPAGLGVANKIAVNFGTNEIVTDEVTYGVDGSITFNQAGQYTIRFTAQYGRSGSTGASILVFRYLMNAVQIGNLLVAKVDNADILDPWADTVTLDVDAGDVLTAELIRDSAGNDSGGLFPITTDWGTAPSAELSIYKIK